ncbi:type II toxin-antitoxin system VapC family toxin [Ectothiorhodospiraceae bacterium BW-2]|nr:type II toxin-antitoxin system VapC family toxin [Ectothiorhodospiraceae bacterium BW-2]
MNIAVFDTNIVIDALNGTNKADVEYQRYQQVYISLITWMEVMVGTDENDTLTENFLQDYFITLPITQDVAEKAVIIRKQQKIKLPDAIIKATAQAHNALLVTRNTRDFPENSEGIRIPYQL